MAAPISPWRCSGNRGGTLPQIARECVHSQLDNTSKMRVHSAATNPARSCHGIWGSQNAVSVFRVRKRALTERFLPG